MKPMSVSTWLRLGLCLIVLLAPRSILANEDEVSSDIRLSIPPYMSREFFISTMKPLADYLSKSPSFEVSLQVGHSFESYAQAVVQGRFELMFEFARSSESVEYFRRFQINGYQDVELDHLPGPEAYRAALRRVAAAKNPT